MLNLEYFIANKEAGKIFYVGIFIQQNGSEMVKIRNLLII
jgi:hypothetical protein